MLVYYDVETGAVDFIMKGLEGMALPPGNYVEVEDNAQIEANAHLCRVEDGAVVMAEDEHLAETRLSSVAQANALAGAVRLSLITDIPGQDMVYMQKEAEARDWMAATDPQVEDYPHLAAEVGITAPSAEAVAQVYLNMAYQLRIASAQLEQLRLGTIAVIENAPDVPTMQAALDNMKGMLP